MGRFGWQAAGAIALASITACGGGGGTGADADPNAPDADPDAPDADPNAPDGAGRGPCPGAEPDQTNTGVPAGTNLTVVDDDVTVDTDGTVIDAQDIHGFLRISASHVTVRRSIVRGYATAATTAIIRIDDNATDVVIEDSEIAAAEPSVDVDGLWGSHVIARRLHVHGGVDGMKLGDDSRVECSYIHDLAYFDSDPNQGGGPTHNDAVQILAGVGITLVGNNLLAVTDDNAAIQITQDFGAVDQVMIERNWADGGGCTYNFSHNGGGGLTVVTRDNRFGRSSFFDCPILKSTQTTLDSMGDVWDDDGTPVPVQTHD